LNDGWWELKAIIKNHRLIAWRMTDFDESFFAKKIKNKYKILIMYF